MVRPSQRRRGAVFDVTCAGDHGVQGAGGTQYALQHERPALHRLAHEPLVAGARHGVQVRVRPRQRHHAAGGGDVAHLVQPHLRVVYAGAGLAVGVALASPGVAQPFRFLHHGGALVVDGVAVLHALHGVDQRRVQRRAGGVTDFRCLGRLDVLVHQFAQPPLGRELAGQRVVRQHQRLRLGCLAGLAGQDVHVRGHRVERGQLRGPDVVPDALDAHVEAVGVEGGTGGVEKLQHDGVRAHIRQVEAQVHLDLQRVAGGQMLFDVTRVPHHRILLRAGDGCVALLHHGGHRRSSARNHAEALERVLGVVGHAKFHVKRIVGGDGVRGLHDLHTRLLAFGRAHGQVRPVLRHFRVVRRQRHGGGGEHDGSQRGVPVHRGVALPAFFSFLAKSGIRS